MQRWQNKVAVVTGASSGIGAACVKDLVANGMIVVGLARRLERMENDVKKSLPADQQKRFHAVQCDVSNEDQVVKAFEWIEKNLVGVDVLINNAGIRRDQHIVGENNSANLRALVDTNILGVAWCTREAFRSMKKRNFDGHVVIMNSLAGHRVAQFRGEISTSLYSSTKHAITAMTEVLRQEFMINKTNIKVTSISPGGVDTDIVYLELPAGYKLLRAEDISDAVVYCIQTPPSVQIHEMIIRANGQ